jgi:predicted transcriptional regulator
MTTMQEIAAHTYEILRNEPIFFPSCRQILQKPHPFTTHFQRIRSERSMETLEKTTVYLPSETRRRLTEVAHRRKVTQAQLIREALVVFLASQETPALRSLGAGHSDEITGRTARRWLRENWQAGDHAG